MNIINRLSQKKLESLLADPTSREVILVQGARQVGKTTLVEQVLKTWPDAHSMNLERDIEFLRRLDRTQSFDDFHALLQSVTGKGDFDRPGTILFMDEAQESTQLGSYIRFMKEEWKHIKVILTGSSMSRIFRSTERVPVGRYRPWLVTPFVFEEFLMAQNGIDFLQENFQKFQASPLSFSIQESTHQDFLKQLDQYLQVGGLPKVVLSALQECPFQEERKIILDSQEDDFVRKSSLSDRHLFLKGMKGVANFLGFPSKFSHISEHKKEAEKVLSELVGWNLVYEIDQKTSNATTQLLPKRYLYDIGMAQDLREMPFPRLSVVGTTNPGMRTQLGGLFENTLLIQLVHDQAYSGGVSGWKAGGPNAAEIDFILRLEKATIPVECKATQKVSKKHWSPVKNYLDLTQQKLGILVSAAPFEVNHVGNYVLINIPLYLFRLELVKFLLDQFGES